MSNGKAALTLDVMKVKRIIVILLIALSSFMLAAFIYFLVFAGRASVFPGQQEKVAKIYITQSVRQALTAYRVDTGDYPKTEEGFSALVEAPKGKENKWRGPYLEDTTYDPWGNPYQYRYPGEQNRNGYDLFSLGPDGIKSDDDITNWEESNHNQSVFTTP